MNISILKTRVKIEFSFLLIIALSLVLENENVLIVLLYSILHELGHIIALVLLGGRVDMLTFSYYGIGMKFTADFGYVKEIIFLLAGLVVNAIFAALNLHRDINLALFVLNVLPIYPLDCGRVLKIVLNNILSFDISERIFNGLGLILIVVFAAFAIYVKSVNLILIAIYIFVLNRGCYDKKRS